MSDAIGLFVDRVGDHWYWLIGLFFMAEPLAEVWWTGYRDWADRFISRKVRSRLFIALSVLALFVASFLAFADQYRATQIAISERDEARRQLNGSSANTWRLGPDQEKRLKSVFARAAGKFNLLVTTTPGVSRDAVEFLYDFMHALDGTGWNVTIFTIGDAEYSPKEVGLMVAFAAGTDPEKNLKARLLKSLLEEAGFAPRYIAHHKFPETATMLVIGRRP